jgi:phosphohistidine phosphatase
MKRRYLMILRHGKSDWNTGQADFDRPLEERGRLGSQRMGAWLQAREWTPDVVVSSPAERARATAEAVCKVLGLPFKEVRWDERIYGAPLDELLAVLADCPKNASRVLLVGHNPGLEYLTEYLAAGELAIPADGKLLPTSALAVLEMPDDWRRLERGCASLVSVTRPDEVPDKFPAKATKGERTLDRPDYYYTQSAVIPYRKRDGELEILIVASRKGSHWIVPKGIKEPELSLRESAAKEAQEEAGVRGHLGAEPLGAYDYEKWGGVCNVAVFPMEVIETIPETQWEERHRQRQWVTVAEARLRLKEPELRRLVTDLARRLGFR